MAEHGGYRKPSRPAPVSGPGALSRRTDGGPAQAMQQLSNAKYGEQKNFQEIQGGAPLAGAPQGPPPAAQGAPQGPPPELVGMGAPTGQPGVPVTAGANAGSGPDASVLGINDPMKAEALALGKYLPVLIRRADADDATPEFRRYVRRLMAAAAS